MNNTTDKAMREAFEAWAVKIGRAAVEDGEVCFFASSFKNVAWLAWQAALASSAATPLSGIECPPDPESVDRHLANDDPAILRRAEQYVLHV